MKHFVVELFYGCKIISSRTGLNPKLFMFAKSLPRNRFQPKISIKHFSVENFFMVAKSFPRKQFLIKNFHEKFLDPKFLMVAKSFPRKQV